MGNAMDQWMDENPDVTVVNDSSEDIDDQVNHNDPDDGDSSGSSSSDDNDSTAGGGSSSNPAPGLGGGGGVSDTSPDDGGSDDSGSGSDDSSGSSDNPFGGDYDDPTPDIRPDNDNPFDDSGSSSSDSSGSSSDGSSDGGSSSSSSDNSDNDSTPDSTAGGGSSSDPAPGLGGGGGVSDTSPDPDTGQGIGPDGTSGSEASTPDAETDAPQNDSTEDIEATRTGKLEDTASDPRVREQAQSLEDDVAGKKVTDVVDGLKTTGAELREEDVEVVRDGDQLKAELSPVGEERVQNIADRQADESVERAVEDELNTSFTNEDVSVNDDGSVDVSEDVQQEATEQAIADSNPGVREDDVTFEDGDPQVQKPRQSGQSGGQPAVGQSGQVDGEPAGGQTQGQPDVQEPTEFIEDDPDEIPSDPLLDRQTRSGIRGAANDVANTLVGTDSPDADVQQQLTSGPGIADVQEEQQIAEDIEQRQEFFGVAEEAEAFAEDTTGSETVGQAAAGLGRLPGEAAAATAGLTLVADKGVETASNFASTAQSEGVIDTSETVLNTITDTTRNQVITVRENPVREGAALAGGIAAGTAATKAVGRSAQGVSNLNTRRKADATVDFEDITSERGAEGELPEFETSPGAPTSEAVQEVRERAADQPVEIQTAGDINTASGELGFRAGQRVGEIVPDTSRISTPDISRPSTPDVSTPDVPDASAVANRAGRAAGRVENRLPDRQSTPDQSRDSSGGGTTLNEAVRDRAESTLDNAEQRGRDAGERAGSRVQDARERLSDAASPVTDRANDALDRAEERGRAAGERTGETVQATTERLNDATDPVSDRLDQAAASASAAANRPFDAAERAGQRAGRRLGEAEKAAGFEGVSADNGFSEGALFRSETDRLPADLEAQEGQYELPGLFASPDASPLRTSLGASRSLSDFRPRLARPSDFSPDTQRFSGFEGDRIEGMPSRAAGSGRVSGPDGEPMPDPDAAGTRFLRTDADEGTAYVRATGDRTTELEAIFPEGSEFRRQRQLAVDLPNDEVATLDVFERRGSSVDGPDSRRSDVDGDTQSERVFRSDDIRELERRRSQSPDGQPVAPTASVGSGSGRTGVSSGLSGGLSSGAGGSSGGRSDVPSPASGLSGVSVSSGLTGFTTGFGSPGFGDGGSGPGGSGFDEPGLGRGGSSTFTTGDGTITPTPRTPPSTTPDVPPKTPPPSTPNPTPGTPTERPEFELADTETDEFGMEFEDVRFQNAVASPADVLGISFDPDN
ncbi:hypothetical protein [Haloarcula rubripromontorii]|uniref:hypothetical protein n=1 Tax=Haloarcula rubripromontorii TaxID=1705562 RepID=UPI00345B5169